MLPEEICFYCEYYKAYYIKDFGRLQKQKIGLCKLKANTVKEDGSCNRHIMKICTDPKPSLEKKLDQTIALFTELKQILEAEREQRM